jgi:hypothetical protein
MLIGTFSWPFDPLFRPTIGVFQAQTLLASAPTFRVAVERADGTVEWVCAYKIRAPLGSDSKTKPNITIACLETGQVLKVPVKSATTLPLDIKGGPEATFPQDLPSGYATSLPPVPYGSEITLPVTVGAGAETMLPKQANKKLGIDDLIAIGRHQRLSWDSSGFLDFLELSVIDQIQLLYIDILGRDADQSGLLHYANNIIAGHKSILEIRDELLASEEFQRREVSPEERVGGWIVWGGLKNVQAFMAPSASPDPSVLPELKRWAAAHSVFISYFEAISSNANLADHLSRIALGWNTDYFSRKKWLRAHSKYVTELIRKVKQTQDRRYLFPAQASHPVSFKGFLESMLHPQTELESAPETPTIPFATEEAAVIIRDRYARIRAGLFQFIASLDRRR